MAHNHNHSHHHHHHHHHHGGSLENIRLAFFINFIFTLIEIVGGLLTNSMAVLADALHDLGDSVALALSWAFESLAQTKKRSETFSYGYQRFSLLAALINGLILIIGSVVILYHAIPRFLNPQEVYAPGMLGLAVLGIAANGLAVWRLKGGETMNEKVVSWHLLEDMLGWTAVLIGSIIMMIWEMPWIDPLLSVLITLFILYNILSNFKNTLLLFLQGTPPGLDLDEVEEKIGRLPCVKEMHHTHVWSLDGVKHILTTHIKLERDVDLEMVLEDKRKAREIFKEYGLNHATIEIEVEGEEKSSQEADPKPPGPAKDH